MGLKIYLHYFLPLLSGKLIVNSAKRTGKIRRRIVPNPGSFHALVSSHGCG